MGSEKRERQKENRRTRLEAEAEYWRRRQRNKRFLTLCVVAFVVGLVVLVVNVFGDDDESSDQAASTTTTVAGGATTTLPPDTNVAGPTPTAPPPGETVTGDTACPPADGSAARTTAFEKAPPTCIDPEKEYDAVVVTDAGEFTITLDAAAAPETVNSFVVLARYHYFDGVPFHRVIPGFVVQGGDATGDPAGTGDPGYSLPDELPASVDEYIVGSVAMANSGPDTGGSQFFVWLGPNPLPGPNYSLFGQVTAGLEIVQLIEADGTAEGTPATIHVIESVEIVERDAGSGSTTSAPSDATTTTAAG